MVKFEEFGYGGGIEIVLFAAIAFAVPNDTMPQSVQIKIVKRQRIFIFYSPMGLILLKSVSMYPDL